MSQTRLKAADTQRRTHEISGTAKALRIAAQVNFVGASIALLIVFFHFMDGKFPALPIVAALSMGVTGFLFLAIVEGLERLREIVAELRRLTSSGD